MSKPIESNKVDRRLASRYVLGGQLDEASYQKHLKALPDVADKAAPVETRMTDDDSDSEE